MWEKTKQICRIDYFRDKKSFSSLFSSCVIIEVNIVPRNGTTIRLLNCRGFTKWRSSFMTFMMVAAGFHAESCPHCVLLLH